MNQPIVYLVGAGPGDPELLTLKAKRCIENADVIIYDNLVNKDILRHANDTCEKIYVGKIAGRHTLPQDEINKLILSRTKTHRCIVRLKGGDPFVFGRGGEEALVLAKNNVVFELVPGITAGIAAPEYAGIPVTQRTVSSSVSFITGHEAREKSESTLNWAKIAHSADTLVFYMGVKNLPNIIDNLISHGLSPDTPIALVQEGTTAYEKTVTGNLNTIIDQVNEKKISAPSIIIVGEVVRFHEQLNWKIQKPLSKKTVVTTRDNTINQRLDIALRDAGAHVINFPVIKPVKLNTAALQKAITELQSYDWIIFTSQMGVKYFFEELFAARLDTRALGGINTACIGPATEKALKTFTINTDILPDNFDGEGLYKKITDNYEVKDKKILVPRSKIGRKYLTDSLKNAGAIVDDIPVYDIVMPEKTKSEIDEMKALIMDNKIDIITFTSSSTAHNFIKIINKDFLDLNKSNIKIASIGPVTSKTLKNYGLTVRTEADTYTIEGLVLKILETEGTK